ncbi:hypothetical protein HYZ05_02640 [Candidatus Daviesbacteria bacterium]|nr:hypothetical protein [Candidatus Daviesbacteria bacterium]
MEKLKALLTVHKTTVILVTVVIALLFGGFQIYQKFFVSNAPVEEVDLPFDAEGPYALLYPRKDGHALILNVKRTSSYEAISYELAYTSKSGEVAVEGGRVRENREEQEDLGNGDVVDRGVQGIIETKDKKGEYEQEILFGTCSKNVCKYDQGVANGTLTLHIVRASSGGKKKAYRMITQWHLEQPDVALGKLTSLDNHFTYRTEAKRADLANVAFTIINDLTGVPKLPSGKEVLGKVYSLNVPIAKNLGEGQVSVELVENPPADAKIYRFYESTNKWQELITKIDGSKLSAQANGAGIFAVLTSQK